jgi:regulation of enolase protein 1 (concanavalin A-like superfamily)
MQTEQPDTSEVIAMPGIKSRLAAYQQNTVQKKKVGHHAGPNGTKRVGKLQQKLLDPNQFESAAAANMPHKPVFQVDDSAAATGGVNVRTTNDDDIAEEQVKSPTRSPHKSPLRRKNGATAFASGGEYPAAAGPPLSSLSSNPNAASDRQNAIQPQRRSSINPDPHSTLTKADYDLHPDRHHDGMSVTSENSDNCAAHAMFSGISMNHGNHEREQIAKQRLNILLQREMRDAKVASNYAACRVRYLRAVGKLRPVDYFGTASLNDSFNMGDAAVPSDDVRARRREIRKTEHEKKGRYDELKETWHDYDDAAQDKPMEPTPEELDLENDLDEIENEIHEEWEDFTEDVLQAVEEEKELGVEEEDDDIELWRKESEKLKKDAEYRKKRKEERIKKREEFIIQKQQAKTSNGKETKDTEEPEKDVKTATETVDTIQDPASPKGKTSKKKEKKTQKMMDDIDLQSHSLDPVIDSNQSQNSEDIEGSFSSLDDSMAMLSDAAFVGGKKKHAATQGNFLGEKDDETSLEEDILANVERSCIDMKPKQPTRAKSGDLMELNFQSGTTNEQRTKSFPQPTQQPRKKKELRIEYDNGIPKEIMLIINQKGMDDDSYSSVSGSDSESESEPSFISASDVQELLAQSPKKNEKRAIKSDAKPVSPKNKIEKHDVLRIDTLPAQQFYDGTEDSPFIAWTHRPLRSRVDGSQIVVKVPPRTDCWRKTRHNFVMDNAPHYWHRVTGNFEVMVKVSGDFQKMYDKAGIMIRLDAENWICSGLEFFNNELNHMTCVTKDYTDWSMAAISPEAKEKGAWICIKRIGNAYESFCSMDGRNWRQARQGVFTDTKSVRVGIFAACPMGESFKVTFDKYRCKNLL